MEQTGSKLGKEYIKAVYWSTHLFNLYAEHIMWNDGLDEAQAGIKIAKFAGILSAALSQHQ